MSVPALEEIRLDELAVSITGTVALANETTVALGMKLENALVTVSEETPPPDRLWQNHYGPRDSKNRSGGDLIVLVDGRAGAVIRTLWGSERGTKSDSAGRKCDAERANSTGR